MGYVRQRESFLDKDECIHNVWGVIEPSSKQSTSSDVAKTMGYILHPTKPGGLLATLSAFKRTHWLLIGLCVI